MIFERLPAVANYCGSLVAGSFSLFMAMCLAMLRVLTELVARKVIPGYYYCTIINLMGFISGKERQCADSTVHFLHESSSSRELGSSQVPNVCSFSFSLSLSLSVFFFFFTIMMCKQ